MTKRGLALVTALVLSVAAAPLLAASGAAGSSGRQAIAATATAATAAAASAPSGFVRADQVGYLQRETKLAYLMTTAAAAGQQLHRSQRVRQDGCSPGWQGRAWAAGMPRTRRSTRST